MTKRTWASAVAIGVAAVLQAAEWEVSVGPDTAFAVTCLQAPVANVQYMFWGANWDFAAADIKPGRTEGGVTPFTGTVGELGLTLEGSVRSPSPNVLRYEWTITAARELSGITGGGLQFNLVLNSPALGPQPPEPVLLENKRGWNWPVAQKSEIRAEFDAPPASVYFERGNKHTVRAMLVGTALAAGAHRFALTVTLPEGASVVPSLAERYGPADTSTWYADAMRWDQSPVDLSFLNHKPAGRHGFVQAKGDQFVFADGTPVRFWGGNIAAYAIFSDKEAIRTQARRIAKLGYNLMRIHHHDSTSWVGRTVIAKGLADSQQFDAEVMERLDWWIKCLKDEGVYVWLDLHVGREFLAGDNIGEGFAELAKRSPKKDRGEGKGFCYFNERIEELMRDFNTKYLSHVNPYTGKAYKDEPAIMGLLLTNENNITGSGANVMLGNKGNPWHNAVFAAAVKAFAEANGLPVAETGMTWLPGPSKIFLADREHQWNARMLAHLKQLGVKVPVATCHLWGSPLYALPPLMDGGLVDIHSYGGAEALGANPRYVANYVSQFAMGQAGKPVAITEWNVPWPTPDRVTAPLYVASISALQELDAPMIYNYSQRSVETAPSRGDTWSTLYDPALSGIMPAAALLYRQAHVSPAKKSYCVMLTREDLYLKDNGSGSMPALRTLEEQSKVMVGLPAVKELPWQAATVPPAGVTVVTDLNQDFIPAGQNVVTSDTGELTRNWVKGFQLIDAPKTQAAHGWIGGETLDAGDVAFRVATPKAAVAVSSLDDKPLAQSKHVLITALARVVTSAGDKAPFLSEPVKASLAIRAPAGLRLVPLAADGAELEAVPAPYADGRYAVTLPAPRGTHWFALKP